MGSTINLIVSDPKWNSCLLSIRYIQWCHVSNCQSIYGKVQQVKTWWGVRGEREREQHFNGVRGVALVRNGNGVGWKWPFV